MLLHSVLILNHFDEIEILITHSSIARPITNRVPSVGQQDLAEYVRRHDVMEEGCDVE